MNVLILTASAGGGHTMAAQALSEYIRGQDPGSRVHIIDAINYISPVLDKVVMGTYLNSLKITPKAWSLVYASMNRTGKDSLDSNPFVDKMEELAATRLLPLVKETKPDIILSTHPFATQLLASLCRGKHISLPTLAIITDYGIHSTTIEKDIDAFVIAHESLIPEMIMRGIPREKILPAGIPVRQSFSGTFNRKETLNGIGLDEKKLTVTLVGGSMALGRMETLLRELDSIQHPFNIVALTAKNNRLYDGAVEISLESTKSIAVLRYCDFMDSLLYSTDLLVTKPGGLTISEALISGVPMAIFSAVGGQEEQNTDFLTRNGLALDLGKGENSAALIEALLFDQQRLQAMRERSLSFAKPQAARDIYQHLKDMVKIAEDKSLPFPLRENRKTPDESGLARLKSISEGIRADMEAIPLVFAIMEKLRGYYGDHEEEEYYELGDDEMAELLHHSEEESKKAPGAGKS